MGHVMHFIRHKIFSKKYQEYMSHSGDAESNKFRDGTCWILREFKNVVEHINGMRGTAKPGYKSADLELDWDRPLVRLIDSNNKPHDVYMLMLKETKETPRNVVGTRRRLFEEIKSSM